MKQILLTQSGYEQLAGECARVRVERDRAAERVRHSLEFGGVAAENGDYLDAQQELELLGSRLAAVEGRLADAEIVTTRRDGLLDIGEAVIVRDLEGGEVSEYRIVGTGEADPTRGAVSYSSPVGEALLRRGVGDVVDVATPGGRRRLKIVALDG